MKIRKKDFEDMHVAIHSLRESVIGASLPHFCPRCGSTDLEVERKDFGPWEEMWKGSKIKENSVGFTVICVTCDWMGDISPYDTQALPNPIE